MKRAGRTLTVGMGVWFNARTGHIHLSSAEHGGFISTVAPDPASKRGNPNLYWKLAGLLSAAGKPAPVRPTR